MVFPVSGEALVASAAPRLLAALPVQKVRPLQREAPAPDEFSEGPLPL